MGWELVDDGTLIHGIKPVTVADVQQIVAEAKVRVRFDLIFIFYARCITRELQDQCSFH